MRRQTTIRTTLALFTAAMLGMALSSSQARGDIILQTATLGPDPMPAIGIGALQWIGARFTLTQSALVDHIGCNIEGASTIFGAIVPLSGPDGLPPTDPLQIESYALAGTTFTAPSSVADVSVPLSVALAPGNYGVVFGVGAFGAGGGANLTDGNIPTAQASYFSALNFINPTNTWLDRPTLSGLRIFVTGTQSVPEPSTWIMTAPGLVAVIGTLSRRRAGRLG